MLDRFARAPRVEVFDVRHINSRAERALGRRVHDNDAERTVARDFIQRRANFCQHRSVQRVQDVGTIEREARQRIILLQAEGGKFRHWIKIS